MKSAGKPERPRFARCSRAAWPNFLAMLDLSRDCQAVEEILHAVQPFFRFQPGEVRFSGYARRIRPDCPSEEPFYVQVWNGRNLYHTVAFSGLPYYGILHADLLCPDRAVKIKDDDPVSVVWNGLQSWTTIDPQFQSRRIWHAEGGEMFVSIPWKKVKANRPRSVLDGN